jgi:hypothetical protein
MGAETETIVLPSIAVLAPFTVVIPDEVTLSVAD